MVLKLTQEDYEIIRELREEGVLEDVLSHRVQAHNGFMALVCSDCDQLHDKIEFLRTVSLKAAELERVHLFALNGGGTLLSPCSETRTANEEVILVNHIRKGIEMKDMDTLISKCHAPCGAAYAKCLNFHRVLHRTFEGKLYVKDEIPDLLHVACFAQVDYGDRRPPESRKKTYAVTLHAWQEFIRRHGIRLD